MFTFSATNARRQDFFLYNSSYIVYFNKYIRLTIVDKIFYVTALFYGSYPEYEQLEHV